jgi:asparagine synthase (glutamine-hydrolysing)
VTVATQLSAGFDSNAVTGTAARCVSGQRVIALTAAPRLGYDGPTHAGKLADESPFAALSARQHGLDHVIVRGTGDPLADLGQQISLYEDPFRNILNASWDHQLRIAAVDRGAEVILTGELGNLTLTAGGAYSLGDLISEHAWGTWVRQAWRARSIISRRAILANSFERWIPAGMMSFLERLFYQTPRWWELTFLRREWHPLLRESAREEHRKNSSYEERWAAIRTFDSGTVRKGSLAETPIDTRDPLIDRRIIEFSLSLPPEQLFMDGRSSPLATAALSDRVPSHILKRRIRGHQSADWHERMRPGELRALAEEIEAVPGADDLIDFTQVRRAIDDWPSNDLGSSRIVSRYATYLPMTLAAGLYLREFDRSGRTMRSG